MLTIRQDLKRRIRLMKAIAFGGSAIFIAGVFVLILEDRTANPLLLWLLIAIGIGATTFFGLWVTGLLRVSCPQCGKRLLGRINPMQQPREGTGACPHCGTSFDVPMAP